MEMTTLGIDGLARKIHDDINRADEHENGWVEAKLSLCIHLAEARAHFKSHKEFGVWLDDNKFKLGKNDRMAAIAMGEKPDEARAVLEATERKSLQYIYSEEFQPRFPYVRKTDNPGLAAPSNNAPPPPQAAATAPKAKAEPKPKKPKAEPKPKRKSAEQAGIDAGLPEGTFATSKKPASDDVQITVYVAPSFHKQLEAIAAAENKSVPALAGELLAKRVVGDKGDEPLPKSAQQKIDAAMRAYQRELDAKFDAAVRERSNKWEEERGIPLLFKRIAEMDRRLTSADGGVMSKGDYNTIMRCLHPDSLRSRSEEQMAEAFRLFTHHKLKLVATDREERQRLMADFPRSREDLEARRAQVKAQRKAERAAKARSQPTA